MIPSYLFVRVILLFLVSRHARSAAWVDSSVSNVFVCGVRKATVIAHAYAVCMGMPRARRHDWIPPDDAVYFPACTPCTLASAQARRLSWHAASTNRAQAAGCPCILSCCFACEPRAREGFAPRRKAPSCDGAKRAAGLQACMSAFFLTSGLMCGMHASCSWHYRHAK
jgi:hypothetical protein